MLTKEICKMCMNEWYDSYNVMDQLGEGVIWGLEEEKNWSEGYVLCCSGFRGEPEKGNTTYDPPVDCRYKLEQMVASQDVE